MKTLLLAFTTLLATGSAFAANMPDTAVIHDKSGFYVNLDVDKVLSAQLNYLDHQGREHVLNYDVQGSGCINDH